VGVGPVRAAEVLVGDLRGLFPMLVAIRLIPSIFIVTFERSDRYVEAPAVTAVAEPVLVYLFGVVIGGAGKLEFILIGDTVNVAAWVEPRPPVIRSFSPSSPSTRWFLHRPDSPNGDRTP
jgi:hypothetical protein